MTCTLLNTVRNFFVNWLTFTRVSYKDIYLFINCNTIRNYILIICELSNFESHNPYANRPLPYPLDYQVTRYKDSNELQNYWNIFLTTLTFRQFEMCITKILFQKVEVRLSNLSNEKYSEKNIIHPKTV